MRRQDDEDEDDDFGYGKPEEPQPETCPSCGSRRSSKVSFNWWGGAVGPAIFSLVKCSACGQQYNRKTGRPIGWVHITLYTLVVAAVFGAIFYAILA